MTIDEFNKKYKKYIEDGFYGLEIYNQKVIDFLDKEFEKEIKAKPDFQFAQIKLKFGEARVYTNSDKDQYWEDMVDKILKR